MSNLTKNLIRLTIMIMLLFLAFPSKSEEPQLADYIHMKDLYIEMDRSILSNRNYYLVDKRSRKYGVNLGLNLDITDLSFFNSKLISITNASQFKYIGLTFDTGVKLIKGIELYYKHFSGHALDQEFPDRFPEENALGIRFRLIER